MINLFYFLNSNLDRHSLLLNKSSSSANFFGIFCLTLKQKPHLVSEHVVNRIRNKIIDTINVIVKLIVFLIMSIILV